mmetsp:Transcript_29508/g.78041  ORF Transcript_29508/g.78041 Transcript_29508/m.78041 type:complete len:318 (-) Transcript_29508:28-981(-)
MICVAGPPPVQTVNNDFNCWKKLERKSQEDRNRHGNVDELKPPMAVFNDQEGCDGSSPNLREGQACERTHRDEEQRQGTHPQEHDVRKVLGPSHTVLDRQYQTEALERKEETAQAIKYVADTVRSWHGPSSSFSRDSHGRVHDHCEDRNKHAEVAKIRHALQLRNEAKQRHRYESDRRSHEGRQVAHIKSSSSQRSSDIRRNEANVHATNTSLDRNESYVDDQSAWQAHGVNGQVRERANAIVVNYLFATSQQPHAVHALHGNHKHEPNSECPTGPRESIGQVQAPRTKVTSNQDHEALPLRHLRHIFAAIIRRYHV